MAWQQVLRELLRPTLAEEQGTTMPQDGKLEGTKTMTNDGRLIEDHLFNKRAQEPWLVVLGVLEK